MGMWTVCMTENSLEKYSRSCMTIQRIVSVNLMMFTGMKLINY